MTNRPIQEQFGARVIEAFTEFARADLKSPAELQANEFSHVSDVALRRQLAEVFYGVRWIYKLGLALLTRHEERAAHVRAQIVDYCAVVEGLLSHCIAHAISGGHAAGTGYLWAYPDHQLKPLRWIVANPEPTINRQSFWWLVRIGCEFGVIDASLELELDWLRLQRNTVHLRQRSSLGKAAFLIQSKRAYAAAVVTIRQTKRWKATHP